MAVAKTREAVKTKMTEDAFMRLPRDGRKYELVDGEAKEVPTGFAGLASSSEHQKPPRLPFAGRERCLRSRGRNRRRRPPAGLSLPGRGTVRNRVEGLPHSKQHSDFSELLILTH